jgi:GAF domain-containing protein
VRAEDRLRRLQRVSLALTAAVTIDDVLSVVVELLDGPVAAPLRGVWLRTGSDGDLELIVHRGMPAELAEQFGRIPLTADVQCAVAARERRTIVSTTPSDADEVFAALRDVPRSITGFAAVPLLDGQLCIGVLGIGVDDALDEHELGFFEAVAAQLAQTIVRVRLSERGRRRRAELELLAMLTDTALGSVGSAPARCPRWGTSARCTTSPRGVARRWSRAPMSTRPRQPSSRRCGAGIRSTRGDRSARLPRSGRARRSSFRVSRHRPSRSTSPRASSRSTM